MKRRELLKSLAMTALGGGTLMLGATQAAAATTAEASGGGLAVGQSFQFDQGLKLTFVGVRRDSRCPVGASCVTPGDAVVVLHAHLGNQPVRTYRLHTHKQQKRVSIPSWPPGMMGFKVYSVELVSLTPRPRIGRKPKQADYRLKLAINVAY